MFIFLRVTSEKQAYSLIVLKNLTLLKNKDFLIKNSFIKLVKDLCQL